jgi:hypothetical protein
VRASEEEDDEEEEEEEGEEEAEAELLAPAVFRLYRWPEARAQPPPDLLLETELTCTPRGLRRVRTGYAYQATRLPRWVRTGGAGRLAPRAPRTVRTGYAYQPRALGTYSVLWHPRLEMDTQLSGAQLAQLLSGRRLLEWDRAPEPQLSEGTSSVL